MKPKILLLGATRQTGKDTLCQRLTELDSRFWRFSYADPLRDDLSALFADRFGVYIYNCTPQEKELVRPIMIAYGMAQRRRDPDYWVKRTLTNIEARFVHHSNSIPVVTDCRFMNELDLMKREYDATFVFVERDGAPPPTDEEEKHWPALKERADLVFRWGNNTVEEQLERAKEVARLVGVEV